MSDGGYSDGEYYESRREQEEDARVPDDIRAFVQALQKQVEARDTYEIQALYEGEFAELTERYYKASAWPSAAAVAPLVEDDQRFLVLYREMYFRHVYEKLHPDVVDRIESFQNYVALFDMFLALNTEEPEVELPEQWLWDMVDEFIYQFQAFHQFRAAAGRNLSEADDALLRENEGVWGPQTVFRYLYALIGKARLDLSRPLSVADEEAAADQSAAPAPEDGAEDGADAAADAAADDSMVGTFFHILGRYALVGLLRANCLLGDYAGALAALNPVSLREKRSVFTHVPACHATLYYHLGFCYLMLRRYIDATKTFSSFLLYATRNKGSVSRAFQAPATLKTIERMYGLVALSNALAPQRLDENVSQALRERYGETVYELQNGSMPAFADVFAKNAPKFITVLPPATPYETVDQNKADADGEAQGDADAPQGNDDQSAPGQANANLQRRMFLAEIQQRARLPDMVSYLKLCTSADISKLAAMMEIDEEACLTSLLTLKHKTRLIRWAGGCPASGEFVSSADVHFSIDHNVVHVKENRAPRRYGEFFIRNIIKLDDLVLDIKM